MCYMPAAYSDYFVYGAACKFQQLRLFWAPLRKYFQCADAMMCFVAFTINSVSNPEVQVIQRKIGRLALTLGMH